MDSQDNIKISVLVTFYNQAHYVDRALQSIVEQECDFPIEILIGDDGSDDDTVKKVMEWVRKYPNIITLYQTKKEERETIARFSGSKNRLKLLQHVLGEFYIFLDGDDYFCDSRKLKKQLQVLEAPTNRDCIACAHAIKTVYSNGSEEGGSIEGLCEGKVYLSTYWKKYYFHPDTILIRSSVISKLPLKLLENNFHDNLITFSLLQLGPIYYIPKCMAVYNNDGAGLWTGNKNITNLLITMMNYDMYCIINPQYEKITSKRFAYFWKDILSVRKQIDSKDYILYEEEAKSKQLVWFEKWIHYNDVNKKEQMKMVLVALRKSWWLIFREKGGKIYHLFVKRKPKK